MVTPISRLSATTETAPSGRVLVCLDRSARSEFCIPRAISLARTFSYAVTLVHVMRHHVEHADGLANDALDWEISRQEVRGYLERVGGVIATALGRPVDVKIEQGHPATRIVEVAQELSADLIVLSSHGESASPTWTLGSTAQQVVASTNISVFVAHADTGRSPPESPEHILVPLDGSLRAESVLPTAALLARVGGGEILLAHVVQEPLQSALLNNPEDLALAQTLATRLHANAQRYLTRLQMVLLRDVENISVRTIVTQHPSERQCLLELTRREHASLIVLSAHGTGCDAARAFGNVTTHLLTHSTVSLLVLQDLPDHPHHERTNPHAYAEQPLLRASFASETV
jgi:nucleotide-binding universal stress UspA family protein